MYFNKGEVLEYSPFAFSSFISIVLIIKQIIKYWGKLLYLKQNNNAHIIKLYFEHCASITTEPICYDLPNYMNFYYNLYFQNNGVSFCTHSLDYI